MIMSSDMYRICWEVQSPVPFKTEQEFEKVNRTNPATKQNKKTIYNENTLRKKQNKN